MTVLLETRGLSRRFGAVQAVDGVDLEVRAGEILGIIGPNGCGKTTLFNCISGRMKPSAGDILWEGRDISGLAMHKIARRGLVRTFQESRTFPSGSVQENVEMALAIAMSGSSRRSRSAVASSELLALTGLDGVADALAADLPFGRLRQLGIALALATGPRMLLLDEPAAGLNAAEGAELARILREVHAGGVTLVVVDHDMDFLLPLAKRVVVLAEGRTLAEGLPHEVRRDPAVIEVYLGSVGARLDAVAPHSAADGSLGG